MGIFRWFAMAALILLLGACSGIQTLPASTSGSVHEYGFKVDLASGSVSVQTIDGQPALSTQARVTPSDLAFRTAELTEADDGTNDRIFIDFRFVNIDDNGNCYENPKIWYGPSTELDKLVSVDYVDFPDSTLAPLAANEGDAVRFDFEIVRNLLGSANANDVIDLWDEGSITFLIDYEDSVDEFGFFILMDAELQVCS